MAQMPTGVAKGRDKVQQAFHEVMHNPPKVVSQTKRKKGSTQAHKQTVAIALSKARQAGARVPYAGVMKD